MTALQRWTDGKHTLIAFVAPMLATFIHDFDNDFKDIKERRFLGTQYKLDHLPPWFRQYHSPEKMIKCLNNIQENYFKTDDESDMNPELSLQEILSSVKEMYDEDISDTLIDNDLEEILLTAIRDNEVEFQFFILVIVPCMVFFKKSPYVLYKKAITGDIDALRKLIRLDPSLLHNHRIGRQIQRFRFANKRIYRELIGIPFDKKSFNISIKKLKYSMAGILSLISKQVNEPLAWISTEHKRLTRNTFPIKPAGQIRRSQASQC